MKEALGGEFVRSSSHILSPWGKIWAGTPYRWGWEARGPKLPGPMVPLGSRVVCFAVTCSPKAMWVASSVWSTAFVETKIENKLYDCLLPCSSHLLSC